jgi:hypothetical protein
VSVVTCAVVDNLAGVSDAKALRRTGLPARATILDVVASAKGNPWVTAVREWMTEPR